MEEIATLDELIEYAVLAKQGEASWSDATLLPGCATVRIKVDGPGWNKRIDARGARFIVKFQERVNEAFTRLSGDEIQAPWVKVELQDGCQDMLALLDGAIKVGIEKMTPEQIIQLVKDVIIIAGGMWVFTKVTGQVVSAVKHKVTSNAELETQKLMLHAQEHRDNVMVELASVIGNQGQDELIETLQQAIAKIPIEKQTEQFVALRKNAENWRSYHKT